MISHKKLQRSRTQLGFKLTAGQVPRPWMMRRGEEHLIASVARGYLHFCRNHIPPLNPHAPEWVQAGGGKQPAGSGEQ